MPRKAVRYGDTSKLVAAVRNVCRIEFRKTFGVPWDEDWTLHLREHRDRLIGEDATARGVRRSRHAAEAALRKHGLRPDADILDLVGHSSRLGRLYLGLGAPRPPTGQGTDLPRITSTMAFVVHSFDVLYVSEEIDEPTPWHELIGTDAETPMRRRTGARRANSRQLAVLFLLIDEQGVRRTDQNRTAAEVVARVSEAVARARGGKTMQTPKWMYEEIGAVEPLQEGETATWTPPEPLER